MERGYGYSAFTRSTRSALVLIYCLLHFSRMTHTDSDGETARAFLDSLRRGDLSALLLYARVEVGVTSGDFGGWQMLVVVRARQPFAEALSKLPDYDRKRIAEAVVSKRTYEGRAPSDIIVKAAGDPIDGPATLLPDLILHREMMVAAATGQQQIQEVDDYYIARQTRLIEGCAAAGIKYENPHASLWDWYHFWKAQGMETYADRRSYVRSLFAGPVASAVGRVHNPSPVGERQPTGWERVDRSLGKAKAQLLKASTEEEWQAIGLLCREVLISLGQAVYDREVHGDTDEAGTRIGSTDARRQLFAWLRHGMPGGDNKEIRAHIKASIELAVHLQHRRTATRQLAALCLEATSSAVSVVAIIAGRAA
ncbi:hypothetical protein [Mesorhizobium sp.]|uniref:hypothetical protein n=1 Tax=Mesorhizobium sp. TaxID=1871066 RepID=UPI000FE60EB0|nr:hypothetical protein [Mesorhizobium sp.]RWB07302.1 MAG: hypothetical protein EOQ33_00805 [Mesorhizobium sp.]